MADAVGAACEECPARPSRRRFLGGTAAATAAGLLVAAPRDAQAATSLPQLYVGQNRAIFQTFLSDENTHTNFLIGLVGAASRPKPIFRNLVAVNVKQFVARAFTFENTTARAYTAAAPFINNLNFLSAAIRIALVEASHASYVNALSNLPLVPGHVAFEPPMQQAEVIQNMSPFIASLNGGPTPAYDLARSDANDLNILNFVLLLEYLESEFYNINVPRFFF